MDYNKIIKVNVLTIPDEIVYFACWNKKLTNIITNNSVKMISCFDNNIKVLTINNNLTDLSCDMFTKLNNINNKELEINFW